MTQIGGDTSTPTGVTHCLRQSTPRYEVEAAITAHRAVIGNEYEIVFHAPAIARAARPGQFVEILFGDDYAPLVRRPFSLYRVDPAAGSFSVLYLARGAFTSGLARKREGDQVSLLGPLGRPFCWADNPTTQHILIAGGLGAPPLYFLASELCRACHASAPHPLTRDEHPEGNRGKREEIISSPSHPFTLSPSHPLIPSRLVVINAARTESLLVGLTEFGELDIALHVLTDDGSRGIKGMATDLLTALLAAETGTLRDIALYACGPMPMLRAVGQIAIARDLPCQLSIETSMPCGIGLCQGCAIPVHDPSSPSGQTYALACVEGPVFEARQLVWPRDNL